MTNLPGTNQTVPQAIYDAHKRIVNLEERQNHLEHENTKLKTWIAKYTLYPEEPFYVAETDTTPHRLTQLEQHTQDHQEHIHANSLRIIEHEQTFNTYRTDLDTEAQRIIDLIYNTITKLETQLNDFHQGLMADNDHLTQELEATIKYVQDLEQWINKNTARR